MDNERERLLGQIEELARCKVNDAVKLAFFNESPLTDIDQLDLTPLTGFKRSEKGGVEIQLVNRVEVLKLLVELSAGQEAQQAAQFFRAWEQKAGETEQEVS